MAWKKLDITPPDLPAEALGSLIDAMRKLLETLVGILETMLDFTGAILDPFAAALKGLIDQLKEVVEQYLYDLGGYCLFVPIRKGWAPISWAWEISLRHGQERWAFLVRQLLP